MNQLQLPGQNGHQDVAAPRSALAEAMSSREAAEIQSAMVIAKRFPRDVIDAQTRITTSCRRISLAKRSMYAYPRGGKVVTGPSIRLAETIAQNWGNIVFGIKELEKRNGESTVMAFAWDLETNTRFDKVFNVKHWRDTEGGGKELTSERDIYEVAANQGARRLRSCILGIIPGDVTDAAVDECKKTLAGDSKEPLIDRVRKMVQVFADVGVTKEMIENRLRHNLEAVIEIELVDLRAIYQSLKDGFAPREEYFDLTPPKGSEPMQTGKSPIKPSEKAPEKPAEKIVETPPAPEKAPEPPKEAPKQSTLDAAWDDAAPSKQAKEGEVTDEMRGADDDLRERLRQAEGDEKKIQEVCKLIGAARKKLGPLYEPLKAFYSEKLAESKGAK